MNTSLELSKKLYELSGWITGSTGFNYNVEDNYLMFGTTTDNHVPAYDCGYLLRKLPFQVPHPSKRTTTPVRLELQDQTYWEEPGQRKWAAYYSTTYVPFFVCHADTPEDALCKLAIKLFEEGVL